MENSKKLSLNDLISSGLPQNQITVKEFGDILSDMKMDLSGIDLFESHSIIDKFRNSSPLFNLIVYCALCMQVSGIELPIPDVGEHVVDVYLNENIKTLNDLLENTNKFQFSDYMFGGCDESKVLSNKKGFDQICVCIHQGVEDRGDEEIMLLIKMLENGASASCNVLKTYSDYDETEDAYCNPTSFYI